MAPIVFLLAAVDFIALGVASTTGFALSWFPGSHGLHFLIALVATVITLLVHTLVMLYMLGTAKSLQEAVDAHGLDPSILAWTRTAKARVMPLLGAAALTTVATAIVGGGVDTGRVPPIVHGVLGVLTVVLNVWAFYRQILVIGQNTIVINDVKKKIAVDDIFDVIEEAPTGDEELAPEYVRGRNLVFIGVNTWVPWIYLVIVMRVQGVPTLPFAVFSIGTIVAGSIRMWRSGARG